MYNENVEDVREYVLLINSDAYYGEIKELEGIIEEYLESGGDVDDCLIGLYQPLDDVEIALVQNVDIKDDTIKEDYEIIDKDYDILFEDRVLGSFSELLPAVKYVETILKENPSFDLSENVQIIKNISTRVDYRVNKEKKVDIKIPQLKEVSTEEPNYEEMDFDELVSLRSKITYLIDKELIGDFK